jgi:hypothetical protein
MFEIMLKSENLQKIILQSVENQRVSNHNDGTGANEQVSYAFKIALSLKISQENRGFVS